MTETALADVGSAPRRAPSDRLAVAATRLYDAEIALHIARQTSVDAWIAAAYDRLHAAIREHRAALAAAGEAVPRRCFHRRLAS